MPEPLPGKGLFGWLGRQVAYVKKAIHADPTAPGAIVPHAPAVNPPPVVYQKQQVEELDHPTQPGVKLRRTTIDQVIVNPPKADNSKPDQDCRSN